MSSIKKNTKVRIHAWQAMHIIDAKLLILQERIHERFNELGFVLSIGNRDTLERYTAPEINRELILTTADLEQLHFQLNIDYYTELIDQNINTSKAARCIQDLVRINPLGFEKDLENGIDTIIEIFEAALGFSAGSKAFVNEVKGLMKANLTQQGELSEGHNKPRTLKHMRLDFDKLAFTLATQNQSRHKFYYKIPPFKWTSFITITQVDERII